MCSYTTLSLNGISYFPFLTSNDGTVFLYIICCTFSAILIEQVPLLCNFVHCILMNK